MHYLADDLLSNVETECQIRLNRKLGTVGKIPDGRISGDIEVEFEVEWAKKGGDHLFKQADEICRKAQLGQKTIVVYPYRNDVVDEKENQISGSRVDGRSHERWQTSAIRKSWGNLPAQIFYFCVVILTMKFYMTIRACPVLS